jgi:hypothetical protein
MFCAGKGLKLLKQIKKNTKRCKGKNDKTNPNFYLVKKSYYLFDVMNSSVA